MSFINYLINGISPGSVYAIIAPGYTMVYGIAKMLNFAHDDVIIVGSYVMFIAVSTVGLPPTARVLLAVAICTLLSMTTERAAYKSLRDASSLAVLIMAIDVNYLLQNVVLLIFGTDTKSFTSVATLPAIKLVGGEMTITGETVVTILSCVIVMIGFTAFINESKAEQAMLTVSEDRDAAIFMGINVSGTIAPTFAIGSALAAITDVLLCPAYLSFTLYTGSVPGIKASVVAISGGIGSIPGAFIGSTLLDVIEILSKVYVSSQMSDAIVFSVLIIVLLVKPTGILGKKTSEKMQVSV